MERQWPGSAVPFCPDLRMYRTVLTARDTTVIKLGVKGSWVQIPPSRRCSLRKRPLILSTGDGYVTAAVTRIWSLVTASPSETNIRTVVLSGSSVSRRGHLIMCQALHMLAAVVRYGLLDDPSALGRACTARRYQRTATTITSGGNRNPANADFGGSHGQVGPMTSLLKSASISPTLNATVPVRLILGAPRDENHILFSGR